MFTIIIIVLVNINQYSLLTISGSTSECGPRSDPIACGKATVLRGQSHIGIPAACFMRVDPGPCSQDLIRIYFDSKTYNCKAFSYSGCGGNANRFVSVKNCYKLCHPYYRQRFIPLGADTSATVNPLPPYSDTKTPSSKESPNEQPDGSVDTTDDSTTNQSSLSTIEDLNEETTKQDKMLRSLAKSSAKNSKTTTDANEEKDNILKSSLSEPTNDEKPQVIHEKFDTFAAQMPQIARPGSSPLPNSSPNGPPNGPPNSPSSNSSPQSNYGYLTNIQHKNYNPIGGYLPTKFGYKPQPISRQQTYYTSFK